MPVGVRRLAAVAVLALVRKGAGVAVDGRRLAARIAGGRKVAVVPVGVRKLAARIAGRPSSQQTAGLPCLNQPRSRRP